MLYFSVMKNTARNIKARQKWLQIYEELGSVTKASIKCGISRSTLYRWIERSKSEEDTKLSDKSKRPKNLSKLKVTNEIVTLILDIRSRHNRGAQRISTYLLRKNDIHLSTMTIWRVLEKHHVKPVVKRCEKSDYKLYNKEIPGDRVQLDVIKLAPKAYQFTAIDDYTRMKVIRVYPNKKAENTIHFLGEIMDTFQFPIQHIQTDWGTEFFSYDFQYELHEHFIKFRPNKPKTPHLNGKVERSQQTDKNEFWSLLDLSDKSLNLNALAIEWQNFYNKKRPHSSLKGKTPFQKLKEVEKMIPLQLDVTKKFWESKEKVIPRNYQYLKFIKQNNLRNNYSNQL